jgi:hypothetical protein
MRSVRQRLLIVCALGFLAAPTVGYADVFIQTSDECPGGCGSSPSNFVTTRINADGTETITATLQAGWGFIEPGPPLGPWGTLSFGSVDPGWINFSAILTTSDPNFSATLPGGTFLAPSPQQSVVWDWGPAGIFQNGYAVQCVSLGISAPCSNVLTFELAVPLNLAPDTLGSFFVANVLSPNGNYGFIDFGRVNAVTPVVTPLPGALPLFTTGLAALGLLGWRRKKKLQTPGY